METSAHAWFWAFVSLVGGFSLSFLLYYRSRFPHPLRLFLLILRGAMLALLLYALSGVLLRIQRRDVRKPVLSVMVDNSKSMRWVGDSAQNIALWKAFYADIKDFAERKHIALKWHFIEPPSEWAMPFTAPESPLATLLQSAFIAHEQDPVIAMLLLSDGQYTTGLSPDQLNAPHRIFTLGMGHERPPKDLKPHYVEYNPMTRVGMTTPIEFSINHTGYETGQITAALYHQNKRIASRTLSLKKGGVLPRVRFDIKPKQVGLQHYQLRIKPRLSEANTANNTTSIFIRVIRDQRRVLVLARAPHPDIKAIRLALTQTHTHHVDLRLPYAPNNLPQNQTKPYDVALLYGDGFAHPNLSAYFQTIVKEQIPLWIWITPDTDLELLRKLPHLTGWRIAKQSHDVIQGHAYAPDHFALFSITRPMTEDNPLYPPLRWPDIDMIPAAETHHLLYQKIGKANTKRPLWSFAQTPKTKIGLTIGEGYWQMRMNDYQHYRHTKHFDERILKSIQYLSRRQHKGRFRCEPLSQPAKTGAPIVFKVLHVNTSYEAVPAVPVQVRMRGIDDPHFKALYTRVPDRKQRLSIPPLKSGKYHYTATTEFQGDKLTVKGHLYITQQDAERTNLRTDFPLMRRIAKQSKAQFLPFKAYKELLNTLDTLPLSAQKYTTDTKQPMIAMPWLLGLLIVLMALEWGFRRSAGSF